LARDAFPGRAYGRIIASRDRLLAFWSRSDAYWSAGLNRIFIYAALWITLGYHLPTFGFQFTSSAGIQSWLNTQSPDLWQPHGLAILFLHPPSAEVVWAVCWVAWISTLLALMGFLGRVATVVSALSVSALVALSVSWQEYWSHGFNILCLVPLAFMWNGAPSISVDELVRKFIRRKADEPEYLLWPSLLGQSAIVLFLFAAFYAKLGFLRGTVTLDWVFSDNLRNSVTMPYALRGYGMPWWMQELVSSPPLYVVSAALHMLMQGLPILAIFTRNPKWRLAEGSMFFLGTALLYFIMTLGVASWFLLCALFVDWDYWIAAVLKRSMVSSTPPRSIRLWSSAAAYYSTGFVALFCIVAATKSSWSNRFYPFSPMDFYSTVDDTVTFPERIHARAFLHKKFVYFIGGDVTYHKTGYLNDYRAVLDSGCSYVAPQADDQSKIAFTKTTYKTIMRASGTIRSTKDLKYPWAPWRYYPASSKPYTETGTTALAISCSVKAIPAFPEDPLKQRVIYENLVSVYYPATDKVLMATASVDLVHDQMTVRTYGFAHSTVQLLYLTDPTISPDAATIRPLPGFWRSKSVFSPVKVSADSWYTIVRVHDLDSGRYFSFWGPYLYLHHNLLAYTHQ
jgi:hypothetical protein